MNILYIDPGSGSLLFQALISALLTIAVFFNRIFFFFKYFLKKIIKKKNNKSENTELEDNL
jgi:hypothetical protein